MLTVKFTPIFLSLPSRLVANEGWHGTVAKASDWLTCWGLSISTSISLASKGTRVAVRNSKKDEPLGSSWKHSVSQQNSARKTQKSRSQATCLGALLDHFKYVFQANAEVILLVVARFCNSGGKT